MAPITYRVLDNGTRGHPLFYLCLDSSVSSLIPTQMGQVVALMKLLFYSVFVSGALHLAIYNSVGSITSILHMRRPRCTTVKKLIYTPGLPDSRAHVLSVIYLCYSGCGPRTSSFCHWHLLGACQKHRLSGPNPDLLNQNLHFHKLPR